MKAVVCHGPKDLRIESFALDQVQPGQVVVEIAAGGICGSDLHYYHHGGFGTVRLQEPMVLGHEVAGRIVQVGEQAGIGARGEPLAAGDLVALNPSHPCGRCEHCAQELFNHCSEMRYYGSAMRYPHVQGAFRQSIVVDARQCCVLPSDTSPLHGACAEPLSVGLHAARRAGALTGKQVLVTGCGPIGAMVIAAARLKGAARIVATDLVDEALQRVEQVGADEVINIAKNPEGLAAYAQGKGSFDVVIEASGVQAAVHNALDVLRPRGRLVQLGLGGDLTIPQAKLVSKEIEWCGSFRFHEEFLEAVQLIGEKRVNLDALITGVFPVEEAVDAFEAASDRSSQMKVVLSF